MLVEIPDWSVIFSVIVAFLVGLCVFYSYYKIKLYINNKKVGQDDGHLGRLEYYERQLIDMKIRLDALNMQEGALDPSKTKPEKSELDTKVEKSMKQAPTEPKNEPLQAQRLPNMHTSNAIDYVLHLITDKSMTSRDIQITLGRSREHTSRLMKKLFEAGYVHRNEDVKPYTYSITQQGLEKIGNANSSGTNNDLQ